DDDQLVPAVIEILIEQRPQAAPDIRAVVVVGDDDRNVWRLHQRSFSIRRASLVSSASSSGVALQMWSGPGRPLLSVKCFSITRAPRPTATSAASIPIVWSLNPS